MRVSALGFCAAAVCGLYVLLKTAAGDVPYTLTAEVAIANEDTLTTPIAMGAPIGDTQHLYLAFRHPAQISVFDRETGAPVSVFLDLPDWDGAHSGLLSFAFHPNYAENGLFYTFVHRNYESMGRVVERKRSTTNPLEADPNYERQIFAIGNQNSHNGGWIGFGPDGYLYITTGDGGANHGDDNGLPAQDTFDVHGKVLRIDVSSDEFPTDDERYYAIPPTNPFATSGGAREVFALGLRHPFRASFDRQTGDLYISDVGGRTSEEINFLPAGTNGGHNYGWRALEGVTNVPSNDDPVPPDALPPIHYYDNVDGAAAIGGHVYRGSDFPELNGTYFYADWVTTVVFSFKYDGANLTNLTDQSSILFPESVPRITAFGEDGLGELYIVSNGALYRIVSYSPDFDHDGDVDGDDFLTWQASFGVDDGGDADGDGDTDGDDFLIWQAGFGSTPGGAAAMAAIPTPMAVGATIATAFGRLRSAHAVDSRRSSQKR